MTSARQPKRGPAPRPKPDEDEQEQEPEPEKPVSEARCLLAEVVGTFALTMVAAGGEMIAVLSHGQVSPAARVVAPAMLVMAMIYAIGDVSGAHFNPAVTLAFAARRDFAWSRVPGYWLAEVVGAVLAALVLRALFGAVAHGGATLPHHGAGQALVMEVILTFFLLTVILGTATGHRIVGHNAGVAVGATIALDGLFAGPISGASMNPARSFGPALVGGTLDTMWIYVVGPVTGALLAVGMARLLHGPPVPDEEKAAGGSQGGG